LFLFCSVLSSLLVFLLLVVLLLLLLLLLLLSVARGRGERAEEVSSSLGLLQETARGRKKTRRSTGAMMMPKTIDCCEDRKETRPHFCPWRRFCKQRKGACALFQERREAERRRARAIACEKEGEASFFC
jgi:hypothetical protein